MRPVGIVATGRGGCVSRAPAVSTAMGSAPTDKSQLELLSAWYCPYAQRAWLALEEKSGGVEGVYTLTNAQDIAEDEITYIKSPALLAANPKGESSVHASASHLQFWLPALLSLILALPLAHSVAY